MNIILKSSAAAALLFASSAAMAGVVSDVGSAADHDVEQNDKDWSGLVGLAILSAPEYMGSEDTEASGVPVIIVDYKDTAYFKVNRGGYWFLKTNKDFRMGALIKIRPGAWEKDDDSIEDLGPIPAGFDEPDAQVEAGINAQYKVGMLTIEGQLTSGEDVNAALSLNYDLIKSKEMVLTAQVSIEALGEDTVRYNWFGDIGSADADAAVNTTIGLVGLYSLTPEWKLTYGVLATSLADEIKDSPIVEEDSFTVAFIGALWAF
jgi:outer membrane scaffolding protein for murein synthesis (MipA/OmpV family)